MLRPLLDKSAQLIAESLLSACAIVPGDLHSFPTRRSSDLTDRSSEPRASHQMSLVSECSSTVKTPRSEEHTSELQSPCNLVCRLLLDKKKNKLIAVLRVVNETERDATREGV